MRFKALGMIRKQKNWVPYKLKPRDLQRHFFTCEQLLQKQKDVLHHIVTGDEKWIYYDNPKRKMGSCNKPGHSSTSTTKPNGSKLMLEYLIGLAGCRVLRAAPT